MRLQAFIVVGLLFVTSQATEWSEAADTTSWTEVEQPAPNKELSVAPHPSTASAAAAPAADALVQASSGKKDTGVNSILFIFFSLLIGLLTQLIWTDVPCLRKYLPLPYTVILFGFGLAWGFFGLEFGDGGRLDDSMTYVRKLDPHLLLSIFIPPLLMEAALMINVHVFKKVAWQCLWLAGPGVLVSIGLSLLTARYILPQDFSWIECALFGAIVSATDPVAVGALLKELGAPESLSTVIEGESLFNDGWLLLHCPSNAAPQMRPFYDCSTAFVLFTIFLKNAEHSQSMNEVTSKLLQMSLGGAAFGLFSGLVAVLLLKYNYRRSDPFFELMITLCVPYLTFWTAENPLKLSSVLAVVVMAVVVNRYGQFYIRYHKELHDFWHQISWIANTLVFIISGILVGEVIHKHHETLECGWLFLNYVCMNVIRAIVIFGSFPLLRKLGYGFDVGQASVATWGGLRGAIGLAMGIIVLEDKNLDETNREAIFHYVAFLVLGTLLVNGTSCGFLLQYLQYDCITPTKLALANEERTQLFENTSQWVQEQREGSTSLAQWDIVQDSMQKVEHETGVQFANIRGKPKAKLLLASVCALLLDIGWLPSAAFCDSQVADSQVATKEQLLIAFHARLDKACHGVSMAPGVLLSLKDSCDVMLEGGELTEWWTTLLEPEADNLMDKWACVPKCCGPLEAVDLASQVQAIGLCVGFQEVVAKIVASCGHASMSHELRMSADAARHWMDKQPASVIALAETQNAVNAAAHHLEKSVGSSALDEKQSAIVLTQVREIRSSNSTAGLLRLNKLIESRELKKQQSNISKDNSTTSKIEGIAPTSSGYSKMDDTDKTPLM